MSNRTTATANTTTTTITPAAAKRERGLTILRGARWYCGRAGALALSLSMRVEMMENAMASARRAIRTGGLSDSEVAEARAIRAEVQRALDVLTRAVDAASGGWTPVAWVD